MKNIIAKQKESSSFVFSFQLKISPHEMKWPVSQSFGLVKFWVPVTVEDKTKIVCDFQIITALSSQNSRSPL
jgi:hypothetical protein